MRTYVRMEIACVVDGCLATPRRPGPAGGLRPGRESFDGAGDRAMDDPVAAAERSEAMAAALEGIGAAVETERSGEIFFSVGGLKGLYGGDVGGGVAGGGGAVGGRRRGGGGGRRRRGRGGERAGRGGPRWAVGGGADRGGADADRRPGRRRAGAAAGDAAAA